MSAPASSPAKRRKFLWWIDWLVLAVIILFLISPIIPVAIASSIAESNGCLLNEGGVYPCIVNGTDQGQLLATLGMMGWLFLATGPLGLGALLVWLVVVVVHRLLWGRARRSEARQA